MDAETKMAREQLAKNAMPVRDTPGGAAQEVMLRRKGLRGDTDAFLYALAQGDLPTFAVSLGHLAFATAGICAQFGAKPGYPEYAQAVMESVQDAQRELDRALQVQDWPQVAISAAKLQLTWIGCAANLGLPYGALLGYLHASFLANRVVDRKDIVGILREAGLQVDYDEPASPAATAAVAANDTGAGSLCPACQGNVPCGVPGHPV